MELWHKMSGLGLITCVEIGDIFNCGCNALIVISGDGWVHICYCPRSVYPNNSTNQSSNKNSNLEENLEFKLKLCKNIIYTFENVFKM